MKKTKHQLELELARVKSQRDRLQSILDGSRFAKGRYFPDATCIFEMGVSDGLNSALSTAVLLGYELVVTHDPAQSKVCWFARKRP